MLWMEKNGILLHYDVTFDHSLGEKKKLFHPKTMKIKQSATPRKRKKAEIHRPVEKWHP